MELRNISHIIFDMDGTIFSSRIDWAHVKKRLDVSHSTILEKIFDKGVIDHEGLRFLEDIEHENTLAAEPFPGSVEFIQELSTKGIKTSLITNNNKKNADHLISKFDLNFDCVITREDGMWKPSPDALIHSMKKFNVIPENTLSIGDSAYDIEASLKAGISNIFIIKNSGNSAPFSEKAEYFEDYFDLSRILSHYL